MISKGRHIIASALLLLFVTYTVAYFSYSHVHVVDGVTVVHSHPFGTDGDNHSHTTKQFSTIDQLNHTHYLQPEVCEVERLLFFEPGTASTGYYINTSPAAFGFYFNLRAPPFAFAI